MLFDLCAIELDAGNTKFDETVYRVVQEPRRMWKRYLVGNTRFLAMVASEWFNGQWPGAGLVV